MKSTHREKPEIQKGLELREKALDITLLPSL
jgi:hypothetical protein